MHGAENTTLSTSSMYHRYIRVIHLCMYGPALTSCQRTTAHAQLILSRDHATRNACAFLIVWCARGHGADHNTQVGAFGGIAMRLVNKRLTRAFVTSVSTCG